MIVFSLLCAGAFAVLAAMWEGARPAFVALGGKLFPSPQPMALGSEELPVARAEASVNVVVVVVTGPPCGSQDRIR